MTTETHCPLYYIGAMCQSCKAPLPKFGTAGGLIECCVDALKRPGCGSYTRLTPRKEGGFYQDLICRGPAWPLPLVRSWYILWNPDAAQWPMWQAPRP